MIAVKGELGEAGRVLVERFESLHDQHEKACERRTAAARECERLQAALTDLSWALVKLGHPVEARAIVEAQP